MKLLSVEVENFKNVVKSGEVAVDPAVTCLVGKNESGKTAFLSALRLLNPAQGGDFSIPEHYPAWLEKRHRREMDLDTFCPIKATFQLEPSDKKKLEDRFGKGILPSDTIGLRRQYNGERRFSYTTVEKAAVEHVCQGVSLGSERPATMGGLAAIIAKLKTNAEDTDAVARATALEEARSKMLGKADGLPSAVVGVVDKLTPKFFYYADYSTLPGTIKIRELLKADPASLSVNDQTARSLLEMAGAEDDYLLNPDYELRKRELQNVANDLTQQILDYWSTNTEIRVELDITQRTERRNDGQHAVLDELKIRLWDNRHFLSLPFDERSSGFKWFFSFLAAFSAYEYSGAPIIILLDEPGLGLHARAQKDFLRFIDERLAVKRQVIFTTHSPFMVQPDHLQRVRLVEDKGRETGSVVSADVLATDPDTLFPLQGALGYDLAQHLLVAPHNLVVEGTSDFTYLTLLSRHLIEKGREGLDDRWSIVPVGGADMVPTFVALLGNHLEVTVLVDSQKAGHQRLERLADAGLLKRNRIITVGQVLSRKLADIEDVFAVEDFLTLYNVAFGRRLAANKLTGTDPVLARIERHTGEKFDHGKPADILLRRRDELLPKLATDTLDRFERLFKAINATLPPPS